jgi:chemotaxis protein CheD
MDRKALLEEDRQPEDVYTIKNYFDGNKRFFDRDANIPVIKIISGECYVSQENEMIATILGSCISACIRDPLIKVGGMNHFLLPGDDVTDAHLSESGRYGVFAMENLINGILKLGGRKDRLEVKVFGGGNVIQSSARIGSKNAKFVREFLNREKLMILSEDLEGEFPRRVHYYPYTGKVMMRLVRPNDTGIVIDAEERYRKQIMSRPVEGDAELF